MLIRWARRMLWGPYERACRVLPLVPMKAEVTRPVENVCCIKIGNFVTRALSQIGGYDYTVCYIVDGTLMIDTGFPWARRTLRRVLIELGFDRSLKHVVNTHYHEDHIGNNDLLVELVPTVQILAHPLAVPSIRFPSEYAWYRRFLFGPTPVAEVSEAPGEIQTPRHLFELLHMPGHCPGHLCIWERHKRWLFSGDLYIAPDLDSQLSDADGPQWIASLNKAIELAPEALFDAHGVTLIGSDAVHELLTRKRDFLMNLQARVHAEASTARSLNEITRRVFDQNTTVDKLSFHDGWLSLLTGSDFSRSNLVRTFLPKQTEHRA